jgi:hypothetical protein
MPLKKVRVWVEFIRLLVRRSASEDGSFNEGGLGGK